MLISPGLPGNQMLLLLLCDFIRELCYRPSTNTSFCTESKECLEYELICKTEEYEVSSRSLPSRVPLSAHLCARACVRAQVRHYSPTRWVSTDAEAYFMGVGAAMAFRRLFQYISGANDRGEEQLSSRLEAALNDSA